MEPYEFTPFKGSLAQEKTTEERIAALEDKITRLDASLEEVAIFGAKLQHRVQDLEEKLDNVALQAKPAGNKQGYPREGVKWDGKVRLLAKEYGYSSAEIDEMQEAMDTYFLALVGTSKARVSSDWQLNARTWIKNDARRHGRERTKGSTANMTSVSEDVPEPSQEIMDALRAVLVEPDPLEKDRKARLVWRAYVVTYAGSVKEKDILVPASATLDQARMAGGSAWSRNWDDSLARRMVGLCRASIEECAAKLDPSILKGEFAWPKI